MNEKIDVNKSDFVSEEKLKEYLIAMAFSYGSQMNDVEREMNRRYDAGEFEKETDKWETLKELYFPIFNTFASDKKRVYGGNPVSFGTPYKYNSIEEATEMTATLKTKNRGEVYFRTENNFEAEYLFILIRKDKKWRIDNIKYRWYSGEKWNNIIM